MALKNIKKQFPILKRKIHGKPLVYLDSAASSQKPEEVINVVKNFYEQNNANIHRGVYKLSEEATIAYEKAHDVVAQFINANKGSATGEVIFTSGTTASINTLAYSFGLGNLKKGDEIIVSTMEHHSNFVPWQQLAQLKGAKLVVVNMNDDWEIDIEDLKKKVTSKTKIASLNHVSNTLGSINNIKAAVEILHDKHALLSVDAAQSIPHMKIDVQKINCDFLSFSGHKMFAPTGTGVLYGKEEHLKNMRPFMYGGDMVSEVSFKKTTWNTLPWKFEAGTPNIAGGIGLAAAVKFLQNVEMENIQQHEKELTKYALQKLQPLQRSKDLILYGKETSKGRLAVFSFNLKDIHAHDVASILDREGVAIRAGHHCTQPLMKALNIPATARASFSLYNTKKDVDKLIAGLQNVKKVFG